MAKVEFERAKPHVNVATIERLRQIGISQLGAQQLLSGQHVTRLGDRQLVAELVAAMFESHSRHFVSGHKFTLVKHS
jgi:translation elongation factor EF-Tu-like GTPase